METLKVQYLDEMKRRGVPSLDDEKVVRATVVECFPSLEGKAFELHRVARHIVRVVEEKTVQRKEKDVAQSPAVVPQPLAQPLALPLAQAVAQPVAQVVAQHVVPQPKENSAVAIPMDLISGALSPEELQGVVQRALATPEVQAVFARLVLETIVAKREENAGRVRAREEKKRRKAECRARAAAEQDEIRRIAEEKARKEREAAEEAARAQREAADKIRAEEKAKADEKARAEEREAEERARAMAEQDRIKAQSRAEGPQIPAVDLERQQAVRALKEMGFGDEAKIVELYARHGNNLDAIVQGLIEQSQEGRW
jgi:flagellar biosynthesis GTPase FlhF